MGKFIAVAGNMGVGKTSLVQFLHRRFGLEPFVEPNETNPYLKDFYKDMSRWAFPSQMHFLAQKFRIHRALEASDKTVALDRTVYEDAEIFAFILHRMRLLRKREYLTYRALYEAVVPLIRPPDLMIYLRCPVRAIRKRIRARGRPEEQAVAVNYLRRLNHLYDAWLERYDLSPVLVLDTSRLDYVTDLVDRLDLLEQIERYL